MKELTIGLFKTRRDAEAAINRLHNELGIDNEEISYVYRSEDGRTREVDPADVSTNTPGEGARKGATMGAGIGALAGIATALGVIPVIGPLFAAGPLAAALGITGALGTTAAGALTGAAAGGLIGALLNLGVGEEHAQRYEDEVRSGSILLAVHSGEPDTARVLSECGAYDVNSFSPVAV